MIYFYVISKEIDHAQIENVSKQPFLSFILKEYKIFRFVSFKFNLLAVGVVCLGISHTYKFYISLANSHSKSRFRLTSADIPDKIRIALNILLLPCIAFYLIQIPFKLNHFWLYFFLVFLVFFLANYFLPRITSDFYPNKYIICIGGNRLDPNYQGTYYFWFCCFQYYKETRNIVCIFLILTGMLLFFQFPYNHWVSFAFGILIFCIIIYWIWNFYNEHIVPFTSMYYFGTLDFYKFSFESKARPNWFSRKISDFTPLL